MLYYVFSYLEIKYISSRINNNYMFYNNGT